MLNSLSLCARVNMNLHNLNSEGTEGNQQQTRMVHVLDCAGKKCVVNAVSGDMFKHIFVEHLTPFLIEANQTVCPTAKMVHPDRILLDKAFLETAKRLKDTSAILESMITGCAVTDIAGALYADKAVARKSVVEFGWVVGIPEHTRTEQYFHVKYDPSRGSGTGSESVAGTQAIFHRPASSGLYALVCHLELDRIGLNDVTRKPVISDADIKERKKAVIKALAATLVAPRGAQRNTQFPHITGAEGIISVSRNSVCAPTMSPLNNNYRSEMKSIVEQMNRMSANGSPKPLELFEFNSISEALEHLNMILEDSANGMATP